MFEKTYFKLILKTLIINKYFRSFDLINLHQKLDKFFFNVFFKIIFFTSGANLFFKL